MSRYSVEAKDPGKYTVMVGWDKDYQTFFAQVMRKDIDRDWDMALWKGTNPRELNSVEERQRAVKEFVDIPQETQRALQWDEKMGRDTSLLYIAAERGSGMER